MTSLLQFRNIAIQAEHNDALAKLGSEHDQIIAAFNHLNGQICAEPPPKSPTQSDADRWETYGKEADALQRRMLAWEAKAREFIMKPSLSYEYEGEMSDDDRREMQQQMTSTLTLAKGDMAEARTTLFNNHAHLVSAAKHWDSMELGKRSFRIGKWGLIAGVVGIILALISIWLTVSSAA